jgi:hypothetical protein
MPPDIEELTQALALANGALADHAVHPIELTPAELEVIAGGGVARRRESLDGADRVLGATWTPASRDALWIAIQDDKHFTLVQGLVDEQLPSTTDEKLLYQRIDLPWPIADRQWVIAIRNNAALWEATGGTVWERTWSLSATRGATNESANAVWISVNDGGWLLADAAGGTLLAYHVRSVVDGNIPDEVAAQWAFATLESMLTDIVERAAAVPAHYHAEHVPILRPDGSVIPAMARP